MAGCLVAGIAFSCSSRQTASYKPEVHVQKMQGFPTDESGISQGVSACFAGVHKGKLWIAGGCNFPDIPAAEGGKKRFYQGIYLAEFNSDSIFRWKKAGNLPVPAAYGVSISTPGGLICIGGANAEGALSAVYRLSLTDEGILQTDTLPSLPCTLDNMGGAAIGNILFVAGGNMNGKPTNAVFSLDLDSPADGWIARPAFPGNERIQPVCIAQDTALYLWGGFSPAFDGKPASLATNGYRYSPVTGEWLTLPSPFDADGSAVSLGGGVGTSLGNNRILCTGGVNKDIFLSALQREEALKKAVEANDSAEAGSLKDAGRIYMLQPAEYYRFNNSVYLYDVDDGKWTELGAFPHMARAGATLAGLGDTCYLINGELKPGIRTPEITKITIQQ